jgi:hypothetical protein
MFHAEFDVTPSASGIDAVVGLGDGSASSYTQLVAIVRFNPSGTIDARAGSEYRADVMWPYQAGVRYHIRLDLDVRTHTYSVWLRNDSGPYTAIARGYPFRTEQAGVARLNNVASKVDSAGGAVKISGFQVVADATTADGCLIVTAGDGFVRAPLPDATVLDTVLFEATPGGPNIDAVIGLSAGPAASFSDLAPAVRFAPGGFIDARDGDVYRADVSWPYRANTLDVRMIADLTSHTYSAFVRDASFERELARQYRFRTQQGAVTHLDHLFAIVDSPQGSVTICRIHGSPSTGVAYSREGKYAVLPLAGDQALISDGVTTQRLDARGTDHRAGRARGRARRRRAGQCVHRQRRREHAHGRQVRSEPHPAMAHDPDRAGRRLDPVGGHRSHRRGADRPRHIAGTARDRVPLHGGWRVCIAMVGER